MADDYRDRMHQFGKHLERQVKALKEEKHEKMHAKTQLRLKALAVLKKDKPGYTRPKMSYLYAKSLVPKMLYTGNELSDHDLIKVAYPNQELYFEMDNGGAFTTSSEYGHDVAYYADSMIELLEEIAPGLEVAEIAGNKVTDIKLPGCKNIYYVDL